jgi:hypothetical protein
MEQRKLGKTGPSVPEGGQEQMHALRTAFISIRGQNQQKWFDQSRLARINDFKNRESYANWETNEPMDGAFKRAEVVFLGRCSFAVVFNDC